ncbi:MAG TPA: hypothetical protein ENO00_06835 [Deltaproteobacteria bacterium]|nr:hypothetical protein [Deltaproteobacteria bacterium]
MADKRLFIIRSKKDARLLADKIRSEYGSFSYYVPLMGVSGGLMTIECPRTGNLCTICSTGSGWQSNEGEPIEDIEKFIWKERKRINEELCNPKSKWYMKISSS